MKLVEQFMSRKVTGYGSGARGTLGILIFYAAHYN
jgi:hypothetical protein